MVLVLDINEILYKGNAQEVVIPTIDGELTILDFHQDFLAVLKKGIMRVRQKWSKQSGAQEAVLSLEQGVVSMINNELILLVEPKTQTA